MWKHCLQNHVLFEFPLQKTTKNHPIKNIQESDESFLQNMFVYKIDLLNSKNHGMEIPEPSYRESNPCIGGSNDS